MSAVDQTGDTLDVIMPALGMTQDSGEIVSWHKGIGDAVKPDDILMEVETDKTTMEVEAGFTGYVWAIRAAAGTSVAVGEVIAVLSEMPPATNSQTSVKSIESLDNDVSQVLETSGTPDKSNSTDASRSGHSTVEAPTPTPTPTPTPSPAPKPRSANDFAGSAAITATQGLVPASPKARFAANEQEVNLTRLVRRGIELPIQFGDLQGLSAEPSGKTGSRSQLQAKAGARHFMDFTDWAHGVSDGKATVATIWCMFGASAMRKALDLSFDDSVNIKCERWLNRETDIQTLNADTGGLLEIAPVLNTTEPDLLIRDMTGTALLGYQPAEHESPVSLSITAEDAESLLLSLSFDEHEFHLSQALILLQELGERVAQPLRHLL